MVLEHYGHQQEQNELLDQLSKDLSPLLKLPFEKWSPYFKYPIIFDKVAARKLTSEDPNKRPHQVFRFYVKHNRQFFKTDIIYHLNIHFYCNWITVSVIHVNSRHIILPIAFFYSSVINAEVVEIFFLKMCVENMSTFKTNLIITNRPEFLRQIWQSVHHNPKEVNEGIIIVQSCTDVCLLLRNIIQTVDTVDTPVHLVEILQKLNKDEACKHVIDLINANKSPYNLYAVPAVVSGLLSGIRNWYDNCPDNLKTCSILFSNIVNSAIIEAVTLLPDLTDQINEIQIICSTLTSQDTAISSS